MHDVHVLIDLTHQVPISSKAVHTWLLMPSGICSQHVGPYHIVFVGGTQVHDGVVVQQLQQNASVTDRKHKEVSANQSASDGTLCQLKYIICFRASKLQEIEILKIFPTLASNHGTIHRHMQHAKASSIWQGLCVLSSLECHAQHCFRGCACLYAQQGHQHSQHDDQPCITYNGCRLSLCVVSCVLKLAVCAVMQHFVHASLYMHTGAQWMTAN